MTALVLVRHGQTAWNATAARQGHADISLDDTGRAQAAAAAPYLAALEPVRALVQRPGPGAGDGRRRRRGQPGLPVETDARLREYDVGVRSGLTTAEFAERYPAEHAAWLVHDESLLVEGEESTTQVRDRVLPALRECLAGLEPGETGIVVTHGACLKVGLLALLGWPRDVSRTVCAAWTTAAGPCSASTTSQGAAPGVLQRDRDGRPAPRPSRWRRFRVR